MYLFLVKWYKIIYKKYSYFTRAVYGGNWATVLSISLYVTFKNCKTKFLGPRKNNQIIKCYFFSFSRRAIKYVAIVNADHKSSNFSCTRNSQCCRSAIRSKVEETGKWFKVFIKAVCDFGFEILGCGDGLWALSSHFRIFNAISIAATPRNPLQIISHWFVVSNKWGTLLTRLLFLSFEITAFTYLSGMRSTSPTKWAIPLHMRR